MKVRVGVFFGGRSVEHEVSIISALQAVKAFDVSKYDVVPVYVTRDNRFYIGEDIGKIEEYRNIPELLKKSVRVVPAGEAGRLNLIKYPEHFFGGKVYDYVDIAFPIVHGTNSEDGSIQGLFNFLGVPYAGCDVLSSAVGMDKYAAKTILSANGIPVVDGVKIEFKKFLEDSENTIAALEQRLRYPLIVKPVNLGSSIGIRKAGDRQSLLDAMEYAFRYSPFVLIENVVENLREINCAVLGDYSEAEASECEEPVGSADDVLSYEDKYISDAKGASKGMSSLKRILPAPIDSEAREKVRELAVRTFQTLGCSGVARIDFLMDGNTGELWVNEINTIPGSLAFYLWEPLGMKYTRLLDRIVELALKREREASEKQYSIDTGILENFTSGGAKGGKFAK